MSIADWLRRLFTPSAPAAPPPTLEQFVATRVRARNHPHQAADLTMEFLREALAGRPECPRPGEWLRTWDRRIDLTSQVAELRNRAYHAILDRLAEIDRQETQRRIAEARIKAENILSRNGSRVDKFLELAYRRVATPDEYGDENPAALDEEIRRFLGKLAEAEADVELRMEVNRITRTSTTIYETVQPIAFGIAQALRVRFDSYYRDRKARAAAFDGDSVGRMAGTDFELYLSELLRSAGITDVSSTAATGDQGGDLLFTYRSRRVVVQAKRYGGTVGNKAVQEALAARSYYGCDEAWVVTNARFSLSARTLAKEVRVILIDGSSLEDFTGFIRTHFTTADA